MTQPASTLRQRRGHAALSAIFLCVLITCAPSEPALRDQTAPLGATQRFDSDRFSGDWYIVASHDPALSGVLRVITEGDRLRFDGALSGAFLVPEPGVLRADDGDVLVVMWVDEEFQTASLGALTGDRVMLLSRSGTVPSDKRTAAFEVFDFYGWDTARIIGRQT